MVMSKAYKAIIASFLCLLFNSGSNFAGAMQEESTPYNNCNNSSNFASYMQNTPLNNSSDFNNNKTNMKFGPKYNSEDKINIDSDNEKNKNLDEKDKKDKKDKKEGHQSG